MSIAANEINQFSRGCFMLNIRQSLRSGSDCDLSPEPMESLQGIPPIHVISMKSRPERRRHMESEGRRLGLKFQFLDAIEPQNKQDYPPNYDAAYRKKHFGYDLTPGEVGCFLSHRLLWEKCAASKDEVWCILEDDVHLGDGFQKKIALAVHARKEWDLLRLMSERYDRRGKIHRHLDCEARLMAYIKQPQGTAAYLIQPHTAQVLLESTQRIREPVDNAVDQYWQHGLRLLVLDPPLASIDPALPSAIQARGWEVDHSERRPWWRRLQRDLRNGREDLRARIHTLARQKRFWLVALLCTGTIGLPVHEALAFSHDPSRGGSFMSTIGAAKVR
ncbi:glycosyltransferase family 25 protein [Acidithiobacillus sulfuriphilus]|uniref:glycosyltransferase family 25 protein n=1 Tax=Acidithiobacillus sulfuriphilus TaxID=1867749 RepID=UPI003F635213